MDLTKSSINRKLVIPVIVLFSLLLSTNTAGDAPFAKVLVANTNLNKYNVPSVYPTIQSALDAAAAAGGDEATVVVEKGVYREMVMASGLNNLKLVGKNAKILPPLEFETDPPSGIEASHSSFKIIDCENFKVEGFTFIGDDFGGNHQDTYPMGNAILCQNSSGIVSKNIIFNYLDGICFQVDDPKWLKGDICENYIHNCWWTGIFATGTHELKIQNNMISFTIPKELSISVGIWTDGGTGIISGNQISSYKVVDYEPIQEKSFGIDQLPEFYQFTENKYYRVLDNRFEQLVSGIQVNDIMPRPGETKFTLHRKTLGIKNHFINANHHNSQYYHQDIVMLRPEK